MGNRVVDILKRVLEDVRGGNALHSWSPSSLDPYGLIAIRDAREDEEVRAAVEAIIALAADSQIPDRTQA